MVKKSAIIALILICIIMLSSCSAVSFSSAENLVRPPKLTGDNGKLQQAFENAVSSKGEFILKYPSSGKYRSAYVRYDCDGDGSDEAFVFYSLKTEEMIVNMYMLDYEDGEWKALGEMTGEGSDVNSVSFCDLNNDGVSEVLVGWNPLDSKSNKKLTVYCSYENSQNLNYRAVLIETYTDMYTVDLDNDGSTEILLARINSTSDKYTTDARLLKMAEKGSDYQINVVGEVSLYSEIMSFISITSDVKDNVHRVYIDESADDTYLTEVLYWDSEQKALTAPIEVDMQSVSSCPSSRATAEVSKDIDGDGLIEVPGTKLFPNGSVIHTEKADSDNAKEAVVSEITEGVNDNIFVTTWYKFENDKFVQVKQYIENTADGFRYAYSDKTFSDISVQFYPDEHITQFSKIERDEKGEITVKEQDVLFRITAVDAEDTVSIGSYIISGEKYKYVYEITDDGTAEGIDKQRIVSSFSLIPQK